MMTPSWQRLRELAGELAGIRGAWALGLEVERACQWDVDGDHPDLEAEVEELLALVGHVEALTESVTGRLRRLTIQARSASARRPR